MTFNSFKEISIESILNGYRTKIFNPAQIIEMCIQQYENNEPNLQAWATFDKNVLRRNETTFNNRVLDNIPIGIKDIFNTQDYPTQMGSVLWKNFTPGNDARAVSQLKMAGALIAGKTATAEFAVHSLGSTFNPHHPDYSPGTSSTGSAVAVASGIVPAALGSQTAGSIIRPASYCGVYAMKPSYGLIARTGVLKTTDTLDTVGFFTHFACDLERMLNVLALVGKNFPLTKKLVKPPFHFSAPIKIGVVFGQEIIKSAPYALHALTEWINTISHDKEIIVKEVALPELAMQAHTQHKVIYHKSLSYYFKHEYQNKHLISDSMLQCIEDGLSINQEVFQAALNYQSLLAEQVDALFDHYDALVCLSAHGHAVRRNQPDIDDLCLLWTMAYAPTLNAPVFLSPNGLPFGLQFISRRFHDYRLLAIIERLIKNEYLPASSSALNQHLNRIMPTSQQKEDAHSV